MPDGNDGSWALHDLAQVVQLPLIVVPTGGGQDFSSSTAIQVSLTFVERVLAPTRLQALYSIAHHPQTDGQTERSIRTIQIAPRHYFNALDSLADWPDSLPQLAFEHNNARSGTIKVSPNEVLSVSHLTTLFP